MNAKRLGTIGVLTVALLCATGPVVQAAGLSNITMGRFQDFTVVTLFGDEPMQATHQIVEAKDGKPYRIVVDLVTDVARGHRVGVSAFLIFHRLGTQHDVECACHEFVEALLGKTFAEGLQSLGTYIAVRIVVGHVQDFWER